MAEPLAGNSRPVLAISLAFAAPLLKPLELSEGFGVHMRGPSSCGKTTILDAGASVWGGGDPPYRRAWNATANGIEATAEAHNDFPLFLDELADVRPEDAARVAYQLAAGAGKQRALSDGSGADVRRWRCLFVSTGEIGLADKLREARVPMRMHAGQSVRMIDLAADAGSGFGIFESVPDLAGVDHSQRARTFAERIAAATRTHFGTAGPEFVRRFIENRDASITQVQMVREQLRTALTPPAADGQVQRVARNFALIGAAGELAIGLDVLPWQPGEASRATQTCFEAWRSERGTDGAWETADVIVQLRAVIERDGGSRFELIPRDSTATLIRDRLGFVRHGNGNTEYLVLPQAWQSVMIGRDPRRAARELVAVGIIRPDANGRPDCKVRLPDQRNPQRVYVVSHAALFADGDDGEETDG